MPWKYKHIKDYEKNLIEYKTGNRPPVLLVVQLGHFYNSFLFLHEFSYQITKEPFDNK